MKSHVFLLLAALHSLGCTALPVPTSELQPAASRGLEAALAELNSVSTASRLYRVTRASVSKVIPVGLNTIDLLMKFGIKETECAKDSGTEPHTCDFRPGFFVPSFSCSSRVRTTTTSAKVISLKCDPDGGSSSSESSEEVFSRGRSHFNVPVGSRDTVLSRPGPAEGVPPRGDAFSNSVV